MIGRRRLTVLCAALAVAIGALGAAPAGASARTGVIPPPKGLPRFYAVPKPLPSSKPGTLVKSAKIAAPSIHGTVYRVMYVSRSLQGKAVAVTGVVVVPRGSPPDGGFPVVSWGHGTNGMADQCAPSLDPSSAAPAANQLLEQGWEIVASDYEGEGTPGLLPYIAGESAARSTIDIVRAARQLRAAHASAAYVVWGHSEGGQTAMYALHIDRAYAPELHLRGVVAGAPPSQLNLIYTFLKDSPFRYYLLMAAGGLNAAYGDKAAPLDEVLKPAGIRLLPVLEQGCSGFVANKLAHVSIEDASKGDPFKVPKWKKIIQANDPQDFTKPGAAPLLIIHGGNDEQIPTVSSQLLSDHLCGIGQNLVRWVYPGQSHAGVIGPSLTDMIHWITDRFAGGPNPDPFTPVGQPDVQARHCPA